jgi:hypothetical protein
VVRKALSALAISFLLAHLISLPATFDDIDAVNFALGVRDFDVAQHQPHPPGYPLFIALAKLSTAAVGAAGIAAPAVRGLSVWSAISGAVLLLLIFGLWRTIDGDQWRAAAAAGLAVCTPLFWFTALRPLSDMTGLAMAAGSMLLVSRALPRRWAAGSPESGTALMAGALVAGLAAGFRSQTAVLTGPLLLVVLLAPAQGVTLRIRAAAAAAAGAGAAVWAIPLVAASGGWAGYLAALGSQAGEDFSGVVMLWTHRSLRVAAQGVLDTFVPPWDSPLLAGIVLVLAAAGLCLLAFRRARVAALVLVMFAPYAVFHLLFQETITVRYALPLVIPVAYLASVTLRGANPRAAGLTASAVAFASLWLAVPAAVAYGRTPAPMFALMQDMDSSLAPPPVAVMHRRVLTESRRARAWHGPLPANLLPSTRDFEWLELTHAFRDGRASGAWFIADPRRTDLALIDPQSRRSTPYRWPFAKRTYVGGARPDEMDLVTITRPGWFLEQGWALTPEAAGLAARDGWGPHLRPSVGWIRRRPGEVVMMIGGRHLGAELDPPVRIEAAVDDRTVLTKEVRPGFFLEVLTLPPGTLSGEGPFARLTVSARGAPDEPVPPVAIEQFDLQDPGTPQVGFGEGWLEPEYQPSTGKLWRWMSERAVLWVTPTDRDVTLSVSGESTRRYFPRGSRITVTAGDRQLAVVDAETDFAASVRIPAALLAASGGRVVLASDQMFVPGDRTASPDRRHLAVRLYSVTVEAR